MNNPQKLWNRAQRLAESGNFKKARNLASKLLQSAPSEPALHFLLGYCERKLGNHKNALKHLELARKGNQNDPQVLFQIGSLWDDQGNYAEAERWYRGAVERNSGWAEAWCSLGDMCGNMGRLDEAVTCFRKALTISPQLGGAAYNLAGVLFDENDLSPAQEALETALAAAPDLTSIPFYLALIFWRSGDETRATAQLDQLKVGQLDHLVESYEYIRNHSNGQTRIFGTTCPTLKYAVEKTVVDGPVLEFGVNWGTTIRYLASLTDRPIHGFDSFEGLPEQWGTEKRGSYTTYGILPDVPENVELHKGWFSDTLSGFCETHRAPVALVNIDCDLYSSTVDVFENIGPSLTEGSIVVFDEYFGYENWKEHEFKAFQEYVFQNEIKYEYLAFGVFSNQAVIRITS